jgi:hypothetical protein
VGTFDRGQRCVVSIVGSDAEGSCPDLACPIQSPRRAATG